MKQLLSFFMLLSATFFFMSCERAIDLPLRQADDKLVVEATIENGLPPTVVLSKSYNYFSKIDAALLANSFVHGARIVVRRGNDSAVLKEYIYPVNNYLLFFYSIDTAATAPKIFGQLNATYNMSITVNGMRYTAQTTIPAISKTLDSMWAKPAPNNPDTLKRVLFGRITDPPGLGNYIRYFTSVNDSAYLPGFTSVYDDDITNGTVYNIQILKGVDRNLEIDRNEYGYFRKGDTVTVKLCNIDLATFDFWRTLEFSQQSIGNPFSQPGVVLNNISGGALGCFSGYAAQYRKIIIRQ